MIPPKNNPIQVGALGNARILKRAISALEHLENIKLTAIASGSISKDEALIFKNSKIKVYSEYEELLKDPDIQIIYICLPTGLHYEWALRALHEKKHVVVEKPAVMNVIEAQDLLNYANLNRLQVIEAWWYRFHPLVQELKVMLTKNSLGEIHFISSNFSYVNANANDWRWNKALGGGALFDMFSYHVDLLGYLMCIQNHDIEFIQAFASLKQQVDANLYAELKTFSGLTGHFMAGIDRVSSCQTVILGELGSFVIPQLQILPETNSSEINHFSSNGAVRYSYPQIDAYYLMWESLNNFFQGQITNPMPFEQSIQNMVILKRIEQCLLGSSYH